MRGATPCREGNPDDWYIEADGKQYPDDPDMTDEEVTDLLRRRRHAREACINDCPIRRECLRIALDGEEMSGIWGGYYPIERQNIISEIRRKRNAASQLSSDEEKD